MASLSVNAVKSVGCLVGIPILVAFAVHIDGSNVEKIIFWIVGLALVAGCFFFLKSLTEEKDKPWTFLLPGSISVFVGFVALVVGAIFTSGSQGSSGMMAFFVAIFLIALAYALYYNISGIGIGDGIAVTIVQSCLALFIVASALAFMYFMPGGNDRRHRIS